MKYLTPLLALFFVMDTVTAQDTVKIYINNKLAGTASSKGADAALVTLKKVKAILLKSLTLQINGSSVNAQAYKKTVAATEGNNVFQTVEESKTIKGHFIFSDKKMLKVLASGKKILLQLQLNPADERLMIPSKMLQLCYIVM